jgi:UDP-N-acetylglucosamine:LPS N-acetylglucosamine transferase
LFTYIFKFIYNFIKSFILFVKIRPKVIVTTGPHTAVVMCYIAKIFRRKIIFIETFANSKSKTLSGKLVYPIADTFIVQWESMLNLYPKAIYGGWIF